MNIRQALMVASALIPVSASADGYETGKVVSVIAEGSAYISVTLDGADYTGECSGGARWTLTTSDPLYKEKFAVIQTAAAMGQTITLRYLSGSCGPWTSNSIYYVAVVY